jgi:hypothetical protein
MHPLDQLIFAKKVIMLGVATGAFIMGMKIVAYGFTYGID